MKPWYRATNDEHTFYSFTNKEQAIKQADKIRGKVMLIHEEEKLIIYNSQEK